MGGIAESLADNVIVTDDNPRFEDPNQIVNDILSGMQKPKNAKLQHDRKQAIKYAIESASPQDVVLIAGKGHETYQQVGAEKRPFSDAHQVQAIFKDYVASTNQPEA